MAYPSDFIEKVRASSDIVSVAEQYFPLRRAGDNYTALCPFHSEKTPSFMISKQKQIYKCFGCGEGGNVFTFVMKMDRLSFPEAIRSLAERAGIEVPERAAGPEEKRKNYLFSVMDRISKFYADNLKKSKNAREYLNRRGITDEMAEKFSMGFSPDGESLIKFAKGENISSDDLLKLGLVVERAGSLTDKFRFRVIFPICDAQGRTVGFGGRSVGDSKVKYLNSPETILFRKSEILYAMDKAKKSIIDEGRVIVTEGYMDVLTLHQFGFTNAVGVLGTAFTDSHIYQLARFTEKVYMLFDSDAAGINAALRSAGKVLEAGLETFVIRMLKTKDADDFLHKFGAVEMKERIKEAHPLMEFIRKLFIFRHKDKTPSWKADVVGGIKPFINAIGSAVTREEEIKRTAEALEVSAQAVEKEMSKSPSPSYAAAASDPRDKKKMRDGEKIERAIICFLVNYPEFVDVFHESVKADNFEYLGGFLKIVYEKIEDGAGISAPDLISMFSQVAMSGEDSDFIAELTASVMDNDMPADKEEILEKKKEAERLAQDYDRYVSRKASKDKRRIFTGNRGAAAVEEVKEYMKVAIQRDRKRQGGDFEKERRKVQR